MKNCSLEYPDKIPGSEYRYDSFTDGNVLFNKKKGHLPAMGWNSWNAFGSGNTEALTKVMAEKIIELGLDKLGYKYLVLDDGCYLPARVEGRLSNDPEKFPSGFKALGDFLHEKGLKFGMYNDVGVNLCAGANVGTCGHEAEDAASYVEWGIDFIKVDNCYYLWDNATFSNPENAKYVFAPAIHSVTLTDGDTYKETFTAGVNISTVGAGSKTEDIDGKTYITYIGTFDGTGPEHSPVGPMSSEALIEADIPADGVYELILDGIVAKENGRGSWLQVALGSNKDTKILFDGECENIKIMLELKKGRQTLRLMNHRRQENTLNSYAKFLEGLNEANPHHDIIYSLCEWGKTQPHNWAYKVGDSWRILNDIAFAVGSDGNPGHSEWEDAYTPSITSQYNKCVVMDEFAGLDKGWNDPDMMVIGMDHLNLTQYATHMVMWCMMNSPLMLGLDLRRVSKGDDLYNIIANEDLISLNQDALGIQAKRICSSLVSKDADKEYITNNNRVDILAKPLADGSVALSFINLAKTDSDSCSVDVALILEKIGKKMPGASEAAFKNAKQYKVKNLISKEEVINETGRFEVKKLSPYDNVTVRICPV